MKGKQPAPKAPKAPPKRPPPLISSSEEEEEGFDRDAILAKIAALEQARGIPPPVGAGAPASGRKRTGY